jgi:acetyl esterase/lipase
LLDDARNFAQNAQSQQVFVKLSEWQGLFHVFQMFPMLPAADQAIAEINEFLSLD